MAKSDEDTRKRGVFWGAVLGAAVVSLLSSGAVAKLTGDRAEAGTQQAVRGSDMSAALYLDALRQALEMRFAAQEARIVDLEKQVRELRARETTRSPASALPRLDPPAAMPLPSYAVR